MLPSPAEMQTLVAKSLWRTRTMINGIVTDYLASKENNADLPEEYQKEFDSLRDTLAEKVKEQL